MRDYKSSKAAPKRAPKERKYPAKKLTYVPIRYMVQAKRNEQDQRTLVFRSLEDAQAQANDFYQIGFVEIRLYEAEKSAAGTKATKLIKQVRQSVREGQIKFKAYIDYLDHEVSSSLDWNVGFNY